MEGRREHFGSSMAVVFAMAGSAVGLGNIWRFPYMVGECGGATFVLAYLLCSIIISLPLFYAESIIGKRGQKSAYGTFKSLAPHSLWPFLGVVALLGSFIIVSYYCVVGGWSLDYFLRACVSGFRNDSSADITMMFGRISSSVWEPIIFHTLFLGTTGIIVMFGVKKGIEGFTKKTMPVLFVLMVVLAVYSLCLPGAGAGVKYLLRPQTSQFNVTTLAYAMGQSFFSMSLGVGSVLVYSSYMRDNEDIAKSGFLTTIFDTSFAIIAAFVVMPAVFAAGIEPGSGPSLVFESLPFIFAKMGDSLPIISRLASILFFLAILFAALTSSISLFEVCVAHMVDNRNWKRWQAGLFFFATAWGLGVLCSLSFGVLSDVKIVGRTIFTLCDVLTSNFIMTFGAFAFSLFVGWRLSKKEVWEEFTNNGTNRRNCRIFGVVYFLIKYVAPVMILAICATNLFL